MKLSKSVQRVCCLNDPRHLVGFCDMTGFYCHQCGFGQDRKLILMRTANDAGEEVRDNHMASFLDQVKFGDKFEGVEQYE